MSTSGAPKQGTTGGSAQAEGYSVAPPAEQGGPAVTTRATEAGAPTVKPGALDPDAYYAGKYMGYGDVGAGQDADEAAKDTEKGDPIFEPPTATR
jgi:hypothetical protein